MAACDTLNLSQAKKCFPVAFVSYESCRDTILLDELQKISVDWKRETEGVTEQGDENIPT